VQLAAAAFLLAAMIPALIASRPPPGFPRSYSRRYGYAGLITALVVWTAAAGAWAAFGRHEMIAGPDFLRMETGFGPFRSTRDFHSAVLRLEEYRSRRSRGWRLMVDGVGGRGRIMVGGWLGTAAQEQMGRLLARETGWTFYGASDWSGSWL
jgi:hypothetical protein